MTYIYIYTPYRVMLFIVIIITIILLLLLLLLLYKVVSIINRGTCINTYIP